MKQLSDFLYKVSIWIIVILVAMMLVTTVIEVFSRNFLGFSFAWSGELARFTMIWITFIGASAVYKRMEMPAFDMIRDRISERSRKVVLIITHSATIVFSLIAVYAGLSETFSKTVQLQITPGLGISMSIPYLAIPTGFLFMLVHAIAFLVTRAAPEEGVRL